MKYILKTWYCDMGMEGIPVEYPEQIIEAASRDEALYLYHTSNGINFGSFEDFVKEEEYVKIWGTGCKEII